MISLGDRVSYKGEVATVILDRCNGMVDLAFDYMGNRPDIEKTYYTCGGVVRCIYKDEVELVEKAVMV